MLYKLLSYKNNFRLLVFFPLSPSLENPYSVVSEIRLSESYTFPKTQVNIWSTIVMNLRWSLIKYFESHLMSSFPKLLTGTRLFIGCFFDLTSLPLHHKDTSVFAFIDTGLHLPFYHSLCPLCCNFNCTKWLYTTRKIHSFFLNNLWRFWIIPSNLHT